MIKLTNYEIVITLSWNDVSNHGVCGHTYEMIEYFLILNKHFNTCIFIAEPEIYNNFRNIITAKYIFDEITINTILNNTLHSYKPKRVFCKNVLITDGVINKHIFANKKFVFGCQERTQNINKNIVYLTDNRIYDFGVHYVKKIMLNKIRPPKSSNNNMLIYATNDCRNLKQEYYTYIENKYNENFTVLTNNVNKPKLNNKFTWLEMPVHNIFEHFSTYLYTKTTFEFDCSPRFIVECKYFNKKVIYDINYMDIGLETRKFDIQNNFDMLHLTHNDEIINIIKDSI